eukprot:scaffold543_cov18-Prasinocladus_malaysianus.AAC.1
MWTTAEVAGSGMEEFDRTADQTASPCRRRQPSTTTRLRCPIITNENFGASCAGSEFKRKLPYVP